MMDVAENDDDPMMRAAAVKALGMLDVDEVRPFLVKKLEDKDWVVVTTAVEALGEREYKEAVPDLVATYRAGTSRQDVDVHIQILTTLKKFEADEGVVALLRECVNDPDRRVRTLAAESLRERGLAVPPMESDRQFYEDNFDPKRMSALSAPLGTIHAVIHTDRGDIEVDLFGDDAIQTVANFVALAREGFYDGLTFHRVVPDFVIQGGDPRGDGWGDAGYYIRSEFNRYKFDTGYLGIAHSGKDTGGCQFFITLSPQPHLDGRYTVFGVVRRGMDVVNAIDQGDKFEVRVPAQQPRAGARRARSTEPFANLGEREAVRLESDLAGRLVDRTEHHFGGVVARGQLPTHASRRVQEQHHLHARVVHRHVGVEQPGELDVEAGLLLRLAHRALLDVLAVLDEPGRKGPHPLARLEFPSSPQEPAVLDEDHPRRRHGVAVEDEAALRAHEAVAALVVPCLQPPPALRAMRVRGGHLPADSRRLFSTLE